MTSQLRLKLNDETILIVDDGQDNREFIIEYVLKPNGFKWMAARDGHEGLQMALHHRPDLILLDYNMPRLDGLGVLRQLNARHVDIPVILMTFHGSEDLAIDVYRLGVRDYIKKPYYPEEMLEAIEKALTERRLRREKELLTERVLSANRELQNRVHELNVLYSIGKSVTTLTELEQLFPRVVDAAFQLTRCEESSLFLIENEKLVCRAHRRTGTGRARATNIEIKDTLAKRTVESGQPILLNHDHALFANRKADATPMSFTAAAYAPLVLRDRVIGALGVKNISPDATPFTSHEAALLSALTDYAAIAVENARNYEALRRATEAEKTRIVETFERFVPPSVVSKAIQAGNSLRLGGSRREISVLFADIRGYSTWSENASPEQVLETLNHYHGLAAEVILGWEGTLDKFMGDGLMAIFNAPDHQPDHVHRAADAALALIKAAEEVQTLHGYRLTYSVGVHVGEAVVGYVGTERAMNYTAVGDSVNLAKRLQEYAAPGQVLVDESIIKKLGRLAQARPLGEIKVKGRQRPSLAYELTALSYE